MFPSPLFFLRYSTSQKFGHTYDLLKKQEEEGVPLVHFAAQKFVQESLDFSPNELVIVHHVSGPLSFLRERFLQDNTPTTNLLEHVSALIQIAPCHFRYG